MKRKLEKLLKKILGNEKAVEVTVPERPEFGHYSTAVALKLARAAKKPPLEIAHGIAAEIRAAAPKNFLEKVEVAPPGFVNFWIADGAFHAELAEILKKKTAYGRISAGGKKQKIQVEFVSANPTGPLTLANGRGGFLGDALSNVLEAAGHRVEREYYINDTGKQIITFGKSILAAEGLIPPAEEFYKGEYVKEWARTHKSIVRRHKGKPLELGHRAAADFLKKIRAVLEKKAGIRYDRFTSERDDIHSENYIRKVLALFKREKAVYEKDGAVWLRTTTYGDDKDRVLVTRDGFPTYFLADAGHYLETKKRGFGAKINILGPDHYGYVARIQAAARFVGLKKSEVIVTQAIRLVKDGQEFKMSKRKGTFVEFEELIREVPVDAARFFFLMISPDTHMDFDLSLAKKRSMKNPVYYVQYAHARAVNILKKCQASGIRRRASNLKLLNTPEDMALMRELTKLPEVVAQTAEDYQIHRMTKYAFELARAFHNFYEKERVTGEAPQRAASRAALVEAMRIILANTLSLLGIMAPERM